MKGVHQMAPVSAKGFDRVGGLVVFIEPAHGLQGLEITPRVSQILDQIIRKTTPPFLLCHYNTPLRVASLMVIIYIMI